MNVEKKQSALETNTIPNHSKIIPKENTNFLEKPIYVHFEYNNKKISELIIPDPKLNLEELIKEKANSYNIDKNTFMELVNKNKIVLSDKSNYKINNEIDDYSNSNKNKYSKNNENAFAKNEIFLKEKYDEVNYTNGNLKNLDNYSIDVINKNPKVINALSTANTLNFNKTENNINNNGMDNYNFTKNYSEYNNIDNFIQPKKYSNYDDIDSERNLYEVSNRSQESSSKQSNTYSNNNYKNNQNNYISSKTNKNNNHNNNNNNSGSKPDIKNNPGTNKNSKKMNIIKNLKKAKKKTYEEECDNQELNKNNLYKNNANNGRNSNVAEISEQKLRENHFSDKSRDISSKSTNINGDAIKINLKNQKDSGVSLLNNTNENKINKIFNIKYNNSKNEVSKYKEEKSLNNKLEFLTEREKKNFPMIYSLTSNNEKLFYEPAKIGEKFSLNTNNNKYNFSSSAFDSKKLLSVSARNSKTNLINTKSSFNFKNSKSNCNFAINKDKNNNNCNNLINKSKAKKLNFHKIKRISAAAAEAMKEYSEEASQTNKIYKKDFYTPKSNSNANIFNDNKQLYEIESLYNTDCQILKSAQKRNLLSNKFSSMNSISNLYSTRKTFLSQRKPKSLGPYSSNVSKDPNLTYKPKLNANSIFMNLRKKYSKLLEQEQEKSLNSNKQLFKNNGYNNNNNNNDNNDSYSNFQNRNTEECFRNSAAYNILFEKKIKNKNKRENKFAINYVSKTEESDFSQAKSRGRSVDEINNITNRLYNYASRYNYSKRMREEDYYNSICPFTPNLINDVYKLNDLKPSMRNFFFRLQNWVDKRNLKYETDYENTLYDDKTGEKLFSPRINKGGKYTSRRNDYSLNEATKDRFSELYSTWKQKKEKFENLANASEQEIKFMSNIAHINEKSKEIINNINNKVFLYLFQILSDSEGLIDGRKIDQIDLSGIPLKIKNFLLPILEELNEQNETLSADEFLIASQEIYMTLPYDYKQFLIEWYLINNKSKKQDAFRELADLSFKPKINLKSQVIVKSKLFSSEIYLRAIENLKSYDKENMYVGSNTEN